MPTVLISDLARHQLGYLQNPNEKLKDTLNRLIGEIVVEKKIEIPPLQ